MMEGFGPNAVTCLDDDLLRATGKLHQSNHNRNDGWYTDHKDRKPDTHFHQTRTKSWGERWQGRSGSNLHEPPKGIANIYNKRSYKQPNCIKRGLLALLGATAGHSPEEDEKAKDTVKSDEKYCTEFVGFPTKG